MYDSNKYHRNVADVGPIVEQMQKWGRDLQSAASQLGQSQSQIN